MGMEGNKYYISSNDLDIILNKLQVDFSKEDKEKIIKIINSQSISQEIGKSDFDYNKKITILKVYLEYKKQIINEITPKIREIDYDKDIQNIKEENKFENKIEIENDNKKSIKIEIKNKESEEGIEEFEHKVKKEIDEEIQKGIEDKFENDKNEIDYTLQKKDTEKEELDLINKVIDIKTNILKMRISVINSLRYENTKLYNEICDSENDYNTKQKLIQEYRDSIDFEKQQDRDILDNYYNETQDKFIKPLIDKYLYNHDYIQNYIQETLIFYDNNFETKYDKTLIKDDYDYKSKYDYKYTPNYNYGNDYKTKYDYKYITNDNNADYKSKYDYKYKKYNLDDKDESENEELNIDKKNIQNFKFDRKNLKKAFEHLKNNSKDYDTNEI